MKQFSSPRSPGLRQTGQKALHTATFTAVVLSCSGPVLATNGYFAHGYGASAAGIAGVAAALPLDTLAVATNPAAAGVIGDRADVGLTVFIPRRDATITGNAFAADATYDGNSKRTFLIPDAGYRRKIDSRWAIALAIYGNGGMNTDYASNPYARFGATRSAGVNLEQLFVAPTLSYRLNEQHAVGATLTLAHQRFSAKGIGLFGGFSAVPASVSDQGTDSSTGVGVRIGWLGQLTPQLSVGAAWASPIRGRFAAYRGLFADGGRFDVPENWTLGIAWKPLDRLTIAADLQQIRYGDVNAIGDGIAVLFAGRPLGADGGPGFGWRNQTIVKLGASYDVSPSVTVRAGYSTANQVLPKSETFFNILAPGVVRRHATVGATYRRAGGGEFSAFYAYAPRVNVIGQGSIPPGAPPAGLGGGNANVGLKENLIGIAYGWTF